MRCEVPTSSPAIGPLKNASNHLYLPGPHELLQNVIRWLAKELCVGRTERQARLLIRRLEAARDDLEALRSEAGEAR